MRVPGVIRRASGLNPPKQVVLKRVQRVLKKCDAVEL